MNLLAIMYSAMCLSSKVTNMYYPTCKTYVYFLPYYQHPEKYYKLGKCKLFGNKNIVTGEIIYEYAAICRMNITPCNMTGNYHELAK
jgi:hypothetical protein